MVERRARHQDVQGTVESGEGGTHHVHVLVRPPAAHQAHGRLLFRDAEGFPSPVAFLGREPVARVCDGVRPHRDPEPGKPDGHIGAHRLCRHQDTHTLLARPGHSAQQPQRPVLGGDDLVDETTVRPAEETGQPVQGLARAEHDHRGGTEAAGGAHARRLGQAARQQRHLVRHPPHRRGPPAPTQ